MKRTLLAVAVIFFLIQAAAAQEAKKGLRGEAEAVAEARAMVSTMGGMEIWSRLSSVRFRHEWTIWNRIDSYIEDEILDLTGPRSWVEMRSEIYHRLRAYSPESRYWNVVNGKFSYATEEEFQAAMERAPYNICRLAKAIASDDPAYEVRLGASEAPPGKRLEFYGRDGAMHGWIMLNAKKEPIVWATLQYKYVFGPMKQFGNLRFPNWGATGEGAATYEMISLEGSDVAPDPSLFVPPAKYLKENRN